MTPVPQYRPNWNSLGRILAACIAGWVVAIGALVLVLR